MSKQNGRLSLRQLVAASVSLVALGGTATSHAATSGLADRGVSNPALTISISVHLAKANAALFDRTLAALYDPHSPSYHHWLSDADLQRFSAPSAEINAVEETLRHSGLTILSVDKYGFSLQARGRLADVARVFNTELHDFAHGTQVFRAATRPPALSGSATSFVTGIAGLEGHTVRPQLSRAVNPATGKPFASRPLVQAFAASGNPFGTTTEIFSPSASTTLTGSGGGYPEAIVTGLGYNIISASQPLPDYAPTDLQTAYGLPAAYQAGITGAGQTIVLLEGYGYPTAKADANGAARLAGLPLFTTANFSVVYPIGKPSNPNIGVEAGWDIEIALDIQSSHSIAPDAKILVAACNGQDDFSFEQCMRKIIEKSLGNVVSNSWEEDQDLFAGPPEQKAFEDVLQTAAAKGISFQFSTGDGGDGGLGTPVGAPGVPASAPHGTAVGGTAILNVPGSSTWKTASWGDDIAPFTSGGDLLAPLATAANAQFLGGGGGGESVYWQKPTWQAALPGTGRQTPDVSALGDPYTGFPIVITVGSQQVVEQGWGGTSLSSPIFTAFWALANEKAGQSLGVAGIAMPSLAKGLIDIVAHPALDSLTETYEKTSDTSQTYDARQLFHDVNMGPEGGFPSAVWNATAFGLDGWYGFAFGLDTSLTVGPGWDNATGYGTPNGVKFINAAAALAPK